MRSSVGYSISDLNYKYDVYSYFYNLGAIFVLFSSKGLR